MDWKVLLVIVILVVVAGVTITLGALLSRANRKRRRAEAERDQREGEVRRLVHERDAGKLTDKEAADELASIMGSWSPTTPGSGIGDSAGDD